MITGISIGIVVIVFIAFYNSLVSKRNQTQNAFATMDVMLKKRYDLIPNMIAAVKEYANHEYNTFTRLAELRTKPFGNFTEMEKQEFDRQFSSSSRSFICLRENYPSLRAIDSFLHLQRTLNETEEQLSAARRTYNASVTRYNDAVEHFPGNIIAGMFGFKRKPVYEILEEQRQNPNAGDLFRS